MTDRLLTAEELAHVLNVKRSYVYERADALGALRLGKGPRARLRFDLEDVKRRLRPASCFADRESDEGKTAANRRVSRRRAQAGSGTKVVLLPIRGQSDQQGRRAEAT